MMNNEGISRGKLKRKVNASPIGTAPKEEKRIRSDTNANGHDAHSSYGGATSTMTLTSKPLKRKIPMGGSVGHIPKKKNSNRVSHQQASKEESLTLSQREQRAMKSLTQYIKDCGGADEQVNDIRCKVSVQGDRFQTIYLSSQNRRFNSMRDVAKFLNIETDDKTSSSSVTSQKKPTVKQSKPRNNRELDAERKKLRRELDKLMKNHNKATKALDDFSNENRSETAPLEDELLTHFGSQGNEALKDVLSKPDLKSFPGLPPHCTPDVLLVWDFLCTFSRPLSLEPIDLDDFVAALTYKPLEVGEQKSEWFMPPSPPLYLAEAHLALLKLLLSDQSSDEWWWSTLETPESEAQEAITGKGEADHITPLIKVDLGALLAVDEDPSLTKRWLQALEDVRNRKTNSGSQIKSAVKSALSITTNPIVKTYLHKALREWKSNAAAHTKTCVMWLIGRVREARPDLWGRVIDEEALAEQKTSVAREATLSMEQLDDEPEIENVDDINYGESDDEDSDSDEDENDHEEDFNQSRQDKSSLNGNERVARDDTFVTTSIPTKPPPSLVDLLLPPWKPALPQGSYIISPFTWSCLAGASACRILHQKRRFRNEVDDSLREFRDLCPLTIRERKRREENAPSRIFSESIAYHDDRSELSPLESAIECLCDGKDYLALSPLQKVCLLRILVEAAYDTHHIHNCLLDNIKARQTAVKQLETEERRAKKEAKEESALVESAARNRLASEAKNSLLTKKRREIARQNKYTNEYTEEHLKCLTDEEIAEFDEDVKADFESLPGPQNFSKSEVAAMVKKINEETAFNTTALEVISMEEIRNRESNELTYMKEELASYGDNEALFDREKSAKVDKLKKEIESFEDWLRTLPETRNEAVDALKEAIEDGTVKSLRSAIKLAKAALLMDTDEETNGYWALDLLRDAFLELKIAERRKRVTEAQKELVAKRNKCFVRTDFIGQDRALNRYWQLDCDVNSRIWYETNIEYNLSENVKSGGLDLRQVGAGDEEADLQRADTSNSEQERKAWLRFSRQEYHASGSIPGLVLPTCGSLSSNHSLRPLIKTLDGRGVRENSLKSRLKEISEITGHVDSSEDAARGKDAEHDAGEGKGARSASKDNSMSFRQDGDEAAFLKVCNDELSNIEFEKNIKLLENYSSAIGKRCRLRTVIKDVNDTVTASYQMGTIKGWTTKKLQSTNEENCEPTNECENGDSISVWCLALDSEGEVELTGFDLLKGLIREEKWRNQHDYNENDSTLFAYRNKLGRFCGRAADAPYSSSPLFLARLILKREQEYYMPLKNRSYDNNWGGKSGARNAWIASMKDFAEDLNTVRGGLLTLEDAFFELCGGDPEEDTKNKQQTARELLDSKEQRFDMELESLHQDVRRLWNSKQTRLIYREIMSASTSVGFLALGLDLLCRNCQAYLDATKPATKTTRNSLDGYQNGTSTRLTRSQYEYQNQYPKEEGGRRMNAWQQQHSYF